MLVQSAAEQEAPLLVLPFILEVEATDICVLLEVTVVAKDNILQTVVVILRPEGQVRRHEEKFAERVNILRTEHVSQVACRAVSFFGSFYVLLRTFANTAVVTLA